jgi:hypothetical protein
MILRKQEEKELLGRAIATHGLGRITTFRQEAAMEVRMMGMKGPSIRFRVLFDFKNHSGRVEFTQDGKVGQIYQETPDGRVLWTAKGGKQVLSPSKSPFDFVPNLQTGLMGLFALEKTSDALAVNPKGAIGKSRGNVIVRTQPARLIPLMQGRGEPTPERCESVWTYLFNPDGTLQAERIVQTSTSKKQVTTEISYDRFQVIEGVKVPVEMGVKNNQFPSMASAKIKVYKTDINPMLSISDFKLP